MRALLRISAGVLAASLTGAGGTLAADGDAGTVSVFAFGAGNRALAMGGAFSAVADDASAPLWNPAGLGLLQRAELQASQASLYGLDISEQYGSLVLPSWRWGTVAFGFRRFGVGGIEERTDRNQLLSSDLKDAQSEFRVSYGRAVSSAWSVGGSVLMHQQRLAGYSDMGLGVDVGVLVRPGVAVGSQEAWAERFSVATTLQNLVEPTLRLNRDDVPDPTAIRSGLAYRQPLELLGKGSLLTSFEVAKSRKQDMTVHFGLEFVPQSAVALRAGWNDGDLTAGAGIRWHGYSFDYVLEDNELDTLHRFGATIGFGSTLEQRRLAAAEREDREFRDRLNATFAKRQTEQVEELVERGRLLLTERNYDEALNVAGTVQMLDPENADGRRLQTRALLLKAEQLESRGELTDAALLYGRALAADPSLTEAKLGADRCRAESDRRFARTTRIRALFDEAMVAFADGELMVARGKLEELLEVAPDDAEAQSLLRRTNTAVQVRALDLTRQATRFLDLGLLDEADEVLHRFRLLDANDPDYTTLRTRLRSAQQAQAARLRELANAPAPQSPKVTIPPKGPTLSKKKRQELDQLYRHGMEAMEGTNPSEAVQYWELVWLSDPDYKDVAQYLLNEYLLRGLEDFSKGRLEEAIAHWNKARDVDPTNEKTLSYLERAHQHQERTRQIRESRR